ncbi:YceI family protein [Kiloniella sp. b19]|uniref:YceI family protein n=1 Tax=Kiloniella sp. GXU_MW_B19 TaxID=3141326 RepID=UPI0031D94FFB
MTRFLKSSIAATALMLASTTAFAADQYSFDAGHSEITAAFNHSGISTQTIKFETFDGTIMIDKENPANSQVDVTIDTASVRTNIEVFNGHLQGGDFFDSENHPQATFKSTSVKQTGADIYTIVGDLTIKGNTQPVTLTAVKTFEGEHPLGQFIDVYKGAQYLGFRITGDLLRSDFGLGKYAPLTSDNVNIVINTELAKAK